MNQLSYTLAVLQQEGQDAVSKLYNIVAIAIGQLFLVDNQVKFSYVVSFLSKIKVC